MSHFSALVMLFGTYNQGKPQSYTYSDSLTNIDFGSISEILIPLSSTIYVMH